MAYTSTELQLPAPSIFASRGAVAPIALFRATADYFRRRWTYQRTLYEVQRYSQRDLLDIGADKGVEEFARRAAGLPV